MLDSPWLLGLAGLTALYWVVTAVRIVRDVSGLALLREQPAVDPGRAPAASVCVAARNEAENVEAGVRSMAEQAYPDLEVVAVDDRSEDATGEILERLSGEYERLRVLHVEELPAGWVGKSHALHRAAAVARGDLLLFTDADVVLEPEALARAVGYLRRRGLDHLAAAPEIEMPGPVLRAFAVAFAVCFFQSERPARARDPESERHVGIGAFNLVRRDAYRAAGGHRAVALRPDDDMRLAEALKRAGASADLVVGTGALRVPWYDSLREAVRGLSRSAFAHLDYSPAAAAGAFAAVLVLNVWPWPAAALTAGPARWLNLVCVIVTAGLFLGASRYSSARPWEVLLWPVMGLVFAWILLRSTAGTLLRGGIEWRGTFYPLETLRAGGERGGS